jgi:hypothetical protein
MAEWIEVLKALSPVLVASAWPLVLLITVWIFKREISCSFDVLLRAVPRLNQAEFGKLKVILCPPEVVSQLPRVETIEAEVLPPGETRKSLLTKVGRCCGLRSSEARIEIIR